MTTACEFGIFWSQVQAQQVLQGEDGDRDQVKEMKSVRVGLIDGRHMFEHQGKKICNDQQADPPLDAAMQVVFAMGIEQPSVERCAQTQAFGGR